MPKGLPLHLRQKIVELRDSAPQPTYKEISNQLSTEQYPISEDSARMIYRRFKAKHEKIPELTEKELEEIASKSDQYATWLRDLDDIRKRNLGRDDKTALATIKLLSDLVEAKRKLEQPLPSQIDEKSALDVEKEFRYMIYEVILSELSGDVLDRVQGRIEEAGRVIEAKYKVD